MDKELCWIWLLWTVVALPSQNFWFLVWDQVQPPKKSNPEMVALRLYTLCITKKTPTVCHILLFLTKYLRALIFPNPSHNFEQLLLWKCQIRMQSLCPINKFDRNGANVGSRDFKSHYYKAKPNIKSPQRYVDRYFLETKGLK